MNALSSLVVGNALLVLPLALLAAGVTALGRRPALAHGLWLLVLLKLVTPPFVALPVPAFLEREPAPVVAEAPPPALPVELPATMLPDFEIELLPDDLEYLAEVEPALEELPAPRAETPVVAAPPAEAHAPSRTFTIGPYLAPALGLLWLTGSASWLLLTWVRVRRFQRLLRHAAPATPALRSQAEQVAARLGLSRCPEVQLLPGALSPMLWGLFGPTRLLLPAELFARLDAEQRATLLAHELAHLRRRDHWVRGLEVLATTLYWWHPALWWARRALREAEEQCCDAWVVWALPDAARQYATALLATVDFLSDDRPALPALASGAGQFPILKRRLTMILRGTPPRTLSTTGLLGIVGLGLLLLPVVPTWAQPPGAEPEKRDVKIVVDTIKFTEADPKKAEEVEKAKLELKKLADEMLRMQEQFRNAQKHFEEAAKKLAEMEGGPGKRVFLFEKKLDGVPMVPGVPGVPDVLQFKLRA
ncbi:MAG: M56 family metallopeptidase, partial [Planctomycetia bacterium]|nr:M56 family metallopeptidase [Planctomycetia bacterium]